MDLLIVSHTPHYSNEGQLTGWGPTVQEIDHLATLFDRVIHLAVLYDEVAPRSSLPYSAQNVSILPVRPSGGEGWRNKLDVALAYPGYWRTLHRAMSALKPEDMIHVRCPANLSLLALLQLTFTRQIPRRWIKYAGNWQPDQPDPFSYAFQRWLLKHNFSKSMVTINGNWPEQPPHILSFRNPCLEADDILYGEQVAQNKSLTHPIQLLFVGGLESGKGVLESLEIAQLLASAGVKFKFHFVGDGSKRSELELAAHQAGLGDQIYFHGWIPKPGLAHFYREAHFLILPSKSEGWPKVISEGMAYGVVPLAGAVSGIPQALRDFGTGMALDPSNPQSFVNALHSYLADPYRWKQESQAACCAAKQFTYQAYLEQIRTCLPVNGASSQKDDVASLKCSSMEE